MYFQAAGRTPPPSSASTRSSLAALLLLLHPFSWLKFVVIIEIFEIDYLNNSVKITEEYISTRACNDNEPVSHWLRGRPCHSPVPLPAHRQPAPLVAAHAPYGGGAWLGLAWSSKS